MATGGLTILFTNVWLDRRGGTESVIRDLALGMLRRGHRPIGRGVDDGGAIAECPDALHARQGEGRVGRQPSRPPNLMRADLRAAGQVARSRCRGNF